MPIPQLRKPRPRTLGWILLGFLVAYGLAYVGVNVGILVMSSSARASEHHRQKMASLPGVHNFAHVDARLWRGGAPTAGGYGELAKRGVQTVIDLRAERLSPEEQAMPSKAGLSVVRIPIRDGQPPNAEQFGTFLRAVENAPGPVFVHCGAGVGRTGSVAAAYLVTTGQANATEATLRSLSVGPPSLEQVTFMRGLTKHELSRPPAAVVAISRIADSPRRSWSRLGF